MVYLCYQALNLLDMNENIIFVAYKGEMKPKEK